MSDPLLPFYERELAILRQRTAAFAREHPKIAGRLSLGEDASKDPHVERLLQGVAFLNARLHQRLEDDFPELSDTLLELLYPHYMRPVPSLSIVELAIDRKQAALVGGHPLPRGTLLETEPVDGEPCLYSTCFNLTLWPLEVRAARLAEPPFDLPQVPPADTAAVLQLDLCSLDGTTPIGQMPLGSLRLHLHAGGGQLIYRLYELLLTRCLGIIVGDPERPAEARLLPPRMLVAAGFEADEAALPSDPRSFPGYRLLSELFALPQKFLFLDLLGLDAATIGSCGPRLQISILLAEADRDLSRLVSPTAVRLGCTPVVNLFAQRLDPLRISGAESEYCLTPDARRPAALEISELRSLRAGRPGERPRPISPFYSQTPAPGGGSTNLRYAATRRIRRSPRPDGSVDTGSDLWVALVDPSGGPAMTGGLTLHAEATCTNRNLPIGLPFAVGRPRLSLRDGAGPIGRIVCLQRPTRPLRHPPGQAAAWRLLSHLSLNYLSLIDAGDGQPAAALRELLSLYLHDELDDFAQKQRWIQGVMGVTGRRVAARVPGPDGGIAQGLEVRIDLDEERFADHAGFLFASLLERFFGSHVTLNSFTRLVATSRRQESRKEPWRWPPRAGSRQLA